MPIPRVWRRGGPFGRALGDIAVRRLGGQFVNRGRSYLNVNIDGRPWFVQVRVRGGNENNIQLAKTACTDLNDAANKNLDSGLVWLWRSLDAAENDKVTHYWLIPLKLVLEINAQLPEQRIENYQRNIVIRSNVAGRWEMAREAGPGNPIDVDDCHHTWELDDEEMRYLIEARAGPNV